MPAVFDTLPTAAGAIVLLAAIALMLGGAALVTSGVRMSQEELARRIRLIQPFIRTAAQDAQEKKASEPSLVRAQTEGAEDRDRREIVRKLGKLGIPENRAATAFVIFKLLLALAAGASMLVLLPNFSAFANSPLLTLMSALGAGIGGWFVLPILVRMAVNDRTTTVVSALPDALELLVICVEAGLSLEDSLNRVVTELKSSHPELAEELALTSADLKILPSRDQAFANMAARIDVPTVRSVVTTLSQTMRYGTPLAQALRVVAAEMRNDSLIAMEDRANRLPALLTIPMMLFIMPTIFLIVGGPAALRVIDTVLR